MTNNKAYKAFGRLLKTICESGVTTKELREKLVTYCEIDDLIFLIDTFEDMLSEPLKG